jgi:hypothetical protein
MTCRSSFSMPVATLVKVIQRLPVEEQAKLFDKLGPALEDYLLAKIALDRFKRESKKGSVGGVEALSFFKIGTL